jgi:hypothetical protein
MDIKCVNVWQQWMLSEPDNPKVIECHKKIATYKKEDWEEMYKEAIEITNILSDMVRYSVDPDSSLAFLVYNEFTNHVSKWFFDIDETYMSHSAMLYKFDPMFNAYFNQFYPGLGNYMFDMMTINSKKSKM